MKRNANQVSLEERIKLMSDKTSNDEPGLYSNTCENKPNFLVVYDNSDLREFLAESYNLP